MTREEAINIISQMIKDEEGFLSDNTVEAHKMAIQALSQEPCGMTAEEYRQRMIQAFHNADTDELIAVCVLPTEKEFEHLEWLLKNHYKKEPCGDAINRAEAIKIASGYCHPANVAKELAKLPPVTPQPKTGNWIEHPEIETSAPEYLMFYECSECGDKQCFCKPDIHKKRFCSNCGAKMQESEEV